MKKIIAFLLITLLLLCFSACNEANVNGDINSTTDGQGSTEGTTPEDNSSTNSTGGTDHGSSDIPNVDITPFPEVPKFELHYRVSISDTITKKPTCEATGEKTYSCVCGEKHAEIIPALGHETVIDKAIPPSCTQDGKTEGSHCSRCNKVFTKQEVIPALGGEHVIVIDEAVESTCSQTGLSEGKHCSRCGKIYVLQSVIPEKAHTMGDLIVDKEPTCTEDGKQHRSCVNCDHREEYNVPASHKYTVTEKNSTKTFSCNMCDRIVENVEDIIILFQKNEDGTYTVEVSGGYGEITCHWNTYRPELIFDPDLGMARGTYEDTTQFSFIIDLSSGVGGIPYSYTHINISATDELGQRSVYKFKLSTSELISSEHTIIDTVS